MTRTYSTKGALRDPAVRNHFVYRCWDAEGRLLYVGCSIRPVDRMREHRALLGEMVERTARITAQGPYNYQTARTIERQAIRTEDPLYNGDSPRAMRERRERHETFRAAMRRHMDAGLDAFRAMEAAGRELYGDDTKAVA